MHHTILQEIIKPFETNELRREKQMIENGQERYKRRLEAQTQDSKKDINHDLITKAIHKVSEGISNEVKFEEAKTAGRKQPWLAKIKSIDADTLAYIGLNSCMDAVGKYSSRQTVLETIGHRVELEIWAEGLREFSRKSLDEKTEKYNLFDYIDRRVTKTHKIEKWRELSSRTLAAARGYDVRSWTQEEKLKVAEPIYNVVLEKSGIFTQYATETIKKKKIHTKWKIGLTFDAGQIIKEKNFDASWSSPMFSPMCTPPRPWTEFDTGCYIDPALAASVPLVRGCSYKQRKLVELALGKKVKPEFVQALNAIQATPLKINEFIVEAVKWTYSNNKSFGKFPRKDEIEVPVKPDNFDELDWRVKRRWIDDKREILEQNAEIIGSDTVMAQDISTAEELMQYDEFYSPMNLDTRGRMYHLASFNYTRADHVKAMFNMARGTKVTSENRGVTLLLIAIANHWDREVDGVKLTKMSFNDRADYVFSQIDELINVAENYQDHFEFWSAVDKPFQFLAAIKALNDYLIDPKSICYLPFSIDGSVSGIQHYSAMSLNYDDAHKVNLVPSPVPQDLYGIVAEATLKQLNEDKNSNVLIHKDSKRTVGDIVKLWLNFGVGRKECKRNTMCWTYSSKVYGLTDQLMSDFMAPLTRSLRHGDISKHPFGDGLLQRQACMYLARVNYNSISTTVKSAASGMKFIQNCSDLLAHEGKDLQFTTPAGFPMMQKYTQYNQKKIRLFLYDRVAKMRKRSQVTIRKQGHKVDKKKARAAASPNIIHALDAAHLQKTVLRCLLNGNSCNSFFMIHDSFGTNLEGANTMFEAVRTSFCDMYSGKCMYTELMQQVSKRLKDPKSEDFGEIPEKGILQLHNVKESNYCFA